MSPAEPLRAANLRAALAGNLIGREILVLDETGSTNDFLFGLTTPATPEGLVVFAEKQTAGRGQYGNRWESAPHLGLWFSILLRPDISAEESPRLTAWAAQAVAQSLQQELSLGTAVKPPNDVYVEGRKVAGVLLEMRGVAGAKHLGILGIGINVKQQREDFPETLRERAASLEMLCSHHVDRQAIAVAVLRELDRTYRALSS